MQGDITTILFYVFAAVLTMSALAVIGARNPIYSVFYLILAFFNAAGLFVLIGAEYIAMTLVIVYVGAVAVLFLFVVMMLNVDLEKIRAGFIRYLPLGLLVAVVLFAELGALIYISFDKPMEIAPATLIMPKADEIDNATAIGQLMYTHFALLFQVSGLILLVAMIGAIVLTLRQREGVRKQRILKQVSRKREDAVALVKVKTGEGV